MSTPHTSQNSRDGDELFRPGFEQITAFDEERRETIPLNALEKIRKAAPEFRERFMEIGTADCVRQFICSMAPYPTTFAFNRAYSGLNKFMFFNNRATLVQFKQNGATKNLLFNPFFPDLSEKSGFYQHLKNAWWAKPLPETLLVKRMPSIVQQLKDAGIAAEDIDYLSYDHLHVQDMRPLMGTTDSSGKTLLKPLFPNAKFLFQREEWESVMHLHPHNAIWYVRDGFTGVNTDNLMLYEGDLQLGPGVALIHTPGHTAGNHSLYLNTDSGTFTISENGVGPDCYSPEHSRVSGLRRTAKWKGWEVILNANTTDFIFDQYNSMIKEKLLSGPCQLNPDFSNHHSSSEFTAWHPAAPGLTPTWEHGSVSSGELVASRRK